MFRAGVPRRGRKAADDRRFLEALHFFTVENVRWRALPKEYGHWNTVWKRFERLNKADSMGDYDSEIMDVWQLD